MFIAMKKNAKSGPGLTQLVLQTTIIIITTIIPIIITIIIIVSQRGVLLWKLQYVVPL